MIQDGRSRFASGLLEFHRRPDIARQYARLGVAIPMMDNVSDLPPVPAAVNVLDYVPRWIVRCPTCNVGASYVWLSEPLFLCANCGNAADKGKWRRVSIPVPRLEIERLLMARPNPATRNYEPGESLEDLRAQNAELGV